MAQKYMKDNKTPVYAQDPVGSHVKTPVTATPQEQSVRPVGHAPTPAPAETPLQAWNSIMMPETPKANPVAPAATTAPAAPAAKTPAQEYRTFYSGDDLYAADLERTLQNGGFNAWYSDTPDPTAKETWKWVMEDGTVKYYNIGDNIQTGSTPPAGYGPIGNPATQAPGAGGMGQMPGGVPSVGNSQQALLNEWQKAAGQQATGQIDYAVNRGVTELERALADAQPMFKEQAEAVARDEMQALDNSALYAEARGDKGGIGHSQYNEIQSAAAQNRLAVQQAQTKLATDTARQIADLRAQGEFEKADKLLEITQSYLSQLMNLEKWAAEFGLSYEQFQANLDKWQKEFDFERYKYDTNLGLNKTSQMADLASALLGSGIRLDKTQMDALGINEDQMNEMLLLNQLQATQTPTMSLTTAKDAAKNGVLSDEVLSVLYQNGYTDEMIRKIYSHMEMPANASNDLKRLVDMVKSKKFDSADKAIEFAVGIQNNSSYKNAITDDELNWFAEWLDVQKWED